MKKNLNIIQINGIRGLLLVLMCGCCLAAGFIVFPGWVGMNIWNIISSHVDSMPMIGLFQGVLLWGIIVASYFTFRKQKLVVCLRSPGGLSDEELKSVFADLKKQTEDDSIIKAMMKAREAELKIKNSEEKTEIIQNNEIKKG